MNVLLHGLQPGTQGNNATDGPMGRYARTHRRTSMQSMKNRLPSLPRQTQTAILASHCLRKDPLVHAASVRRQTYAGLAPNLHKLTAQQVDFWLRRSSKKPISQGLAGWWRILRRSDCSARLAFWGGCSKRFFCQESMWASEASCQTCGLAGCPIGRKGRSDGWLRGGTAALATVPGTTAVNHARAVAGAGCVDGVGRLSPSSSALTTRSPSPKPTLMPMPVCISTTEVLSSIGVTENGPGPLLP